MGYRIAYLFIATTCALFQGAAVCNAHPAVDKAGFLVNDDNSSAVQISPRVAVQPGGTFVVTWVDRRNGGNDIYYQKFTKQGAPLEANLLLNDDSADAEQFEAAVSSEATGRYCVVWRDYRNGAYPFKPDVYQTFLDSLGFQVGANRNLTAAPPDSVLEAPDVSLRPDGSGVVVWSDYRNRNWDIYGQLFASSGATVGAAFKINSDAGSFQQHAVSVSASAQNWFVVAWYDNRRGNDDIYAQIFDENSVAVGSNILVNDDATSTRQAFPDVASDGSGHFTVCWVDWRNGSYPSNPDIYARRFDRSGVPEVQSFRVNQDVGDAPQNDPAIATDRLGNVGIVWADSSGTEWDIGAQLFNQLGVRSGDNYVFNTDTLGRQLQPDIAMDGFDMRVVWSDQRSGNFDIYAGIKKYNDPTLITRPEAVTFAMHTTGPAPAPQVVEIVNAGIGSIRYRTKNTANWLNVTPTSGSTPDSLTIAVTSQNLPVGNYTAEIQLVDETTLDSSNSLLVTLTVSTSSIALAPDTVQFTAAAQIGNPASAHVIVNNAGSGTLDWQAVETEPWLFISPLSGAAGDSITVSADITGLTYGERRGYVILSDSLAANSPETLVVNLSLSGTLPIIGLYVDSLAYTQQRAQTKSYAVAVANLGSGAMDWRLSATESWIRVTTDSGGVDDSARFEIDTHALTRGAYRSQLVFRDSGSFNDSVVLPLSLRVITADSVTFENATAFSGEAGSLAISMALIDSSYALAIPLAAEHPALRIDSLQVTDSSLSGLRMYQEIEDSARSTVTYVIAASDNSLSTPIAPGVYNGALTLYFTAKSLDTNISTESLIPSADSISLLATGSGLYYAPQTRHGTIAIGFATDVTPEDEPPEKPQSFEVAPNFPNPFNGGTKFRVYLPRTSPVEVRVFNILGQLVRTIHSGEMSLGWQTLGWDGQDSHGLAAPTGVYFYEVKWQNRRIVRKALLIK